MANVLVLQSLSLSQATLPSKPFVFSRLAIVLSAWNIVVQVKHQLMHVPESQHW